MKKRSLFVAHLVVMMLLISYAPDVRAATLRGKIHSDSGRPLAGLIVELHNSAGPIRKIGPIVTNAEGFFFFPAVPRNSRSPYEITVRWGNRVLHRSRISVTRDVDAGTLWVKP